MSNKRREVETVVEDLFAARVAGDFDSLREAFAEGATFQLAGSSDESLPAATAKGHPEIMSLLERLVANYVLSNFTILKTLVDGETAAVHWRTTVHDTETDRTFTSELAAFIETENGKVVSFIEFLDTGLAAKILGDIPGAQKKRGSQ
jgi:ketosteroid isomerase-like protein